MNRQHYEANLQELNDKWRPFIEKNFIAKYELDFLKKENYFFAIELFSLCTQTYIAPETYKFVLKHCIDNNINDLVSAKFVLETYIKFNASE